MRCSNESSAGSRSSLASSARPPLGGGVVGIARNRQEGLERLALFRTIGSPERSAACSRNRSAISPAVRPPTARCRRSRADPRPALSLPRGRRFPSPPARPTARARPGPAIEYGGEAASLRDAAPEPAAPDIRQCERGENAIEKAGVAEKRGEPTAGRRGGFHRQREDFRVRGFHIVTAEAFEAGLRPFAGLAGLRAENRAEIGIFRNLARLRRGEIGQADGDRVFRAQAKLRP